MKEKTIDINGESFTYMDEVGDPYKFNPMTQEDAQDILKKASELLEECGIEYFLAYGTLLGAVREGNLLTRKHFMRACLFYGEKDCL